MINVNGTELEKVIYNGTELDKVICDGVTVFEKGITPPSTGTITMKTLQDTIKITIHTTDNSPCEVWNDGNKIGVLNHNQQTIISIPNKNEAVIIKGKTITFFYCADNRLISLNVQNLNNLQSLDCHHNQLTSLNIQDLNSLQTFNCADNRLTAQAFKEIFNSLLQTENGIVLVYKDDDYNYKDFTQPQDLVEAFNNAKARGWWFYKNKYHNNNLL